MLQTGLPASGGIARISRIKTIRVNPCHPVKKNSRSSPRGATRLTQKDENINHDFPHNPSDD